MTELQRGSVSVLDKEESPSTISTDPKLQPVTREIRIGSGTQDSSITVIENPLLEGYTGLLLSRYFSSRFQWRDLIEVQHVRADAENNLRELQHYNRVRIDKGFAHVFYNFAATDTGLFLPAPNVLPYETAFITPSEYDNFLYELHRDINVEDVLESMYKLLAQKIPTFSFDNGKLYLPNDYASLRL